MRAIFNIDIFIKNRTHQYKKTTNNMINHQSMKKTATSIMIGQITNGMFELIADVMGV